MSSLTSQRKNVEPTLNNLKSQRKSDKNLLYANFKPSKPPEDPLTVMKHLLSQPIVVMSQQQNRSSMKSTGRASITPKRQTPTVDS